VLGVEAARRALDTAPFLRRDEVTHIVTVSCTGFSNPGLDCHLINDLGLSASVRRYNLGFMGCQASMPALAMAQQFCQADSSAVVLVVSTEICSLHLRADATPDAMLANTLFADGAACAIVHGRENLASSSVFRLDQFATSLAAEGGGEMAWTIGNHGFNLVLSSYIPDLIEANIASLVDPVLGGLGLTRSDVGHWAVHPGGKAVLDKVAAGLDLPADALAISRDILRRYGNMSSATILFVLDELSRQPRDRDETVCAMAFGPGLTIELSVLHARAGVRDEAPAAPTERRA
jgi:predicted naringenin-chalcone synthase